MCNTICESLYPLCYRILCHFCQRKAMLIIIIVVSWVIFSLHVDLPKNLSPSVVSHWCGIFVCLSLTIRSLKPHFDFEFFTLLLKCILPSAH